MIDEQSTWECFGEYYTNRPKLAKLMDDKQLRTLRKQRSWTLTFENILQIFDSKVLAYIVIESHSWLFL